VRLFDLLDVGVAQVFEGIRPRRWHHRFVKNSVTKRLLALHLVERDRSQYRTLLFLAVEQVLVQAFLLLRDKSFLEGHLLVLVPLLHENVVPESIFGDFLQLFVGKDFVVSPFVLLPQDALLHRLEIFSHKATQGLLFDLIARVPDELGASRHASGGFTDAINDQVNLVLVVGDSSQRSSLLVRQAHKKLLGARQRIEVGL
jgi:hypothetical protein